MLQITALPPAIVNLLNRLLVKPPGGIFSLNKPLCVILHLQILAYGYECVCLTQSHAVRLTLLRPFIGDRKVYAYTSNGHFLSTCELVLCCTAIKHCPAWAEMNVAIYYWSFHIKLCCTGINTGRSLTGLKVRNCKFQHFTTWWIGGVILFPSFPNVDFYLYRFSILSVSTVHKQQI